MTTRIGTRLAKTLGLTAAVSLLGAATALADVPGYDFMMVPEGMAMVVDGSGKATKAKISQDTAKAITAGAQPLSVVGIVLLYQGKLYIVPDKPLDGGQMASTMVMSSGSSEKPK